MQASAQIESEKRSDSLALRQFSKAQAAIALALLSAVFIASAVYAPGVYRADEQYFTLCIFKSLTQLPCPGCGLSHSFCAMARGDLLDALKFNTVGPPLFLALILVWIRSLCVLLNKARFASAFDQSARRLRIIRALAIAFALFGAMRILRALLLDP